MEREETTRQMIGGRDCYCSHTRLVVNMLKLNFVYELRSVFLLFFGQKVFLYCFQKKKMKHLPPHSLKDPVKVFQVQPKTHSHRFPTKVTMKRNLMGRYCLKG